MKTLTLLLFIVTFFSTPLFANINKGRERYNPIIDCLPFGAMAKDPEPVQDLPPPEPEITQELIQEESSKIQLCAMTWTPDGRTAVGLVDNGVEPAAFITLFDGESSNGLTLILSNLTEEYATFERDGITFTLKLGLGLIETITPDLLAQREEEAIIAEEEAAEIERKRPNSLAEQLIAMQMSLPPDIDAPPLPIPMGDIEDFTREFDPNKERGDPQTETEALIQAGTDELKAAAEAGESPQDYLKRLVEHRKKEVERQQNEKKRAQEDLDAAIASGRHTEEEIEAIRRELNIDLLKRGVVPLNPVEDLSDLEQAEIDAALDAGYGE